MKKWKTDGELIETVTVGQQNKQPSRIVMQIENAPDAQDIILKIRLPMEYLNVMDIYTGVEKKSLYQIVLNMFKRSMGYYKKIYSDL